MPFTRPPLDYPINQLLLKVGLGLQSWLSVLPVTRNDRERRIIERELVEYFQLEQAVKEGLLRTYRFIWDRYGQLRTIKLVPANQVRRTPGIRELRRLFFDQNWYQ